MLPQATYLSQARQSSRLVLPLPPGRDKFLGLNSYFGAHLELCSTAPRSLSKASEKRRTPSSVSLSFTCFMERPTLAAASTVLWASPRSSVTLVRSFPLTPTAPKLPA